MEGTIEIYPVRVKLYYKTHIKCIVVKQIAEITVYVKTS